MFGHEHPGLADRLAGLIADDTQEPALRSKLWRSIADQIGTHVPMRETAVVLSRYSLDNTT